MKKNSANRQKDMKRQREIITFVGCSGYTNIGDDMYPLVLKKHLRDYDLLFKNSDLPRRLPPECKLLVMGPGGVIFQNATAHADYMSEYMEQAVKRKIPIVFLSCGVQSQNIERWKKYLDYADFITVRSEKDVEYIKQVSDNKNVYYYPDLGYLFDDYEYVPNLPQKYTAFIPIAAARTDDSQEPVRVYKSLPKEERVLVRMGSIEDVQMNYPSWLAQGEAKTIVNVTPAMVNYIIKHASKVYTGRYHGLVFARKNEVPFAIGAAGQLKLQNEDLKNNFLDAIFHLRKLDEAVKKYIHIKKKKRVAIIHDDFSISGGGEKLISVLAHSLQQRGYHAEIFTFSLSENTKKMVPPGVIIHTLKDKKTLSTDDAIKRYLFSELNIQDQFHFFVFSGHASMCAARNHKPNLLYSHNIPKSEPSFSHKHPYDEVLGATDPQNMIVLNEDDVQIYLSKVKEVNFIDRTWRRLFDFKMKYIKRPILPQILANKIDAVRFILNRTIRVDKLKFLTYQFTNKENLREIQDVVTNSQNIKDKVFKKYKRQSDIVYPPIETEKYSYKPHKGYWLSINRIVPLKRIEIQLDAFRKTPEENLIIIGDFESKEYYNYLQSIKPENVKFLGVVREDEKIQKLSECKGFIFTAQDEDFGMSVVEATASGKPVIAPHEGGCIETIKESVTGELITDIDADKLAESILKMAPNVELYREACLLHARKFDVFFFTEKMIQHIEKADPFKKTLDIRITR